MKQTTLFIQTVLCFLLLLTSPDMTVASLPTEAVQIDTAWPSPGGRVGETIPLALILRIEEGFHINADEGQIRSYDSFKPYATKVTVLAADPGLVPELPLYPPAQPFTVSYSEEALMSFAGETIIYLPVTLAADLVPGKKANLSLELVYQTCAANLCLLPERKTLHLSLPILAATAEPLPINQEFFVAYQQLEVFQPPKEEVDFGLFGWNFSLDGSSWAGLLFLLTTAAFGGMLLNFTPCVLPLIPIKIISLSSASKNKQHCLLLGLAMFLGVLTFWLALGAMIALVSGFNATNQLFQYPAFTLFVGLIIAIMALGMFDFFALPLPRFLYSINPEQDTLTGSFALGILAAILSTPCTAPFMGAAAAWAATQPPSLTLTVFAAIGLGMALPYLILSAAPQWVRKMPKTGPASLVIKQVMGLLMLAAAAYFLGVGLAVLWASPPQPPSTLYWWPVMAFSFAAGALLAWRTLILASSSKIRLLFTGLAAAIMAVSVYGALHLTSRGPIAWVYYSPEHFEQAVQEDKVVVMVFTAEWCLNCKVLEQGVLESRSIVDLLARPEIVPMKVDITGSNPPGRDLLRQVGSLSIPLLVIFSPNGKQVYKSDFYTAEQLYEAVTHVVQEF
jgi:thiol:disulfide interchange protein DsbD